MATFKITPNLNRNRLFHAVSGLYGLLLTGYIVYGYIVGSIPYDWYLVLPVSVWVMARGLGRALGYFELPYLSISLNENELKVDGWMGGDIDLGKLSWIRQTSSRIEFEYRSTGNRDYFRIPWSLRKKSGLESLKLELQERCQRQRIEFESDL